jgi:T5SS/PEP-CTERM-associated repeat protein
MKKQLLAVVICVLGATGVADEFVWDNPAGGLYGESENWNVNGVPSIDDTVWFNLSAAYTVTFDMDRNNDMLYADGSDVTLDLAGFEYSLDYSSEGSRAAVIGRYGTSSLTVSNGLVHSREVSIGQYSGAVGSLALSGSGTEWGTMFDENWHGVGIGEDGDATLAVLDDAFFNHGHGLSAQGPDSDAVIEVNGANSQWYVDGQFNMSMSGRTTVDIRNGGRVDIGRLTMGLYAGSSAEINVNSDNQLESELELRAGWQTSLTIGQDGQASIRLYNSSLLNQGSMIIGENPGSNGVLEIYDGSFAVCPNSIAVGGSFDTAGGIGQIRIIDDKESPIGVRFESTRLEGQFIKVWPQGTISMDGGDFAVEYGEGLGNPIILQGGTLEGNGMVWGYVENNGGLVAPGDDGDNKVLDLGYDYTQDAAGTLKIAIAGREPVSEYAHLRVTRDGFGQVSLDGLLDVDLVHGFVPRYEDEFTIIAAQTISGTFSNGVSTYIFEGGSFDVIYNTDSFDSVILTHFIPAPVPSLVEFAFAPGLVYDSAQNITFLKNWVLAGGPMNWSQANDWAANFTYTTNNVTYSNWRLPVTVDEQDAIVGQLGNLVSLYDINADQPAPFINMSQNYYWTSPQFSRDSVPVAYVFTFSPQIGPTQIYVSVDESFSYVIPVFDGPPTDKWCPADFDNNGIVNLKDLAEFASYWLNERP